MPDQELPPIPSSLPVVATANLVIFPFMLAPLTVARASSLKAIDDALQGDRLIVVAMQKEESIEQPTPSDLHPVGCVCAVVRMMRTQEGAAQIIVQGIARARLSGISETDGALRADIEVLRDSAEKPMSIQALMNNLLITFRRIVELSPTLPEEAFQAAQAQQDPGRLADFIASTLNIESAERQKLLDELAVQARLERVTALAANEVSVLELTSQIQSETRKELDKGQRDYILRQQLREIQKQLGEGDEHSQEIEELRTQIEAAGMPDEARKAADRELDRLSRMPQAAADYSMTRNYLDYLIAVPWSVATEDNLDIAHAAEVLDAEHYGLDDIKQRVLEYLAVRRLKPDSKGPILCFAGPPGVGKTSLAQSIAHALGRKSVRMALGGVRDEAEIRGHRRTYIGALPGRIVQGLRDAGSNNPVMILDEIDKLGADYRGDPTSALLEVLDPQQNFSFKDHYLEVSVDLSKVIFITTANVLDPIPAPLRDRMEILRLAGYTEEEKIFIAERYLLPRQMSENGLTPAFIGFEREALRRIVHDYTREAGVRSLEREIGSVCRKVARKVAEAAAAGNLETAHVDVTPEAIEEYLGPVRFQSEMAEHEPQVGVATGMAWTPNGGEILFIETVRMPGAHGLTITGQLGDVMKESARIALDYLRSHAAQLGIPLDSGPDSEIHLHVPAGAIPKDGPSAGVAIATALASLLTGRPARHDISMTGEITLTGRVLPVGGVKEKVLAANQAGIKTIILPERNRGDLRDIPETTRKGLEFVFIDEVRQAIERVLLPAADATKAPISPNAKTVSTGKPTRNGHAPTETPLPVATPNRPAGDSSDADTATT